MASAAPGSVTVVSPSPKLVYTGFEVATSSSDDSSDRATGSGAPVVHIMLATQPRADFNAANGAGGSIVPPPPQTEVLDLTLADVRQMLATLRSAASTMRTLASSSSSD